MKKLRKTNASPEEIVLPVGIDTKETLNKIAEEHAFAQAESYIRDNDLFKGNPTMVNFSMTSLYNGEIFRIRIVMNNRGKTVEDVVFGMEIEREELILLYLEDLKQEIGVLSHSTHTHDWR